MTLKTPKDSVEAKRDEHIEHLQHTMTAQNEKFKGWLSTAKNKLSLNKQRRKTMIKASIFYQNIDGKTFDMDYYTNNHIPHVGKLLGDYLKEAHIEQGVSGVEQGSKPPFISIASLYFDSLEDFAKAFEPYATEIMGDVKNFTDIEPIIQISKTL